MTRSTGGRLLVALIVVVGAIALAGGAYELGLAAAAGSGASAAAPQAAYWYGPWHFGFGFFGLLFPLLFVLLIFGLVRAAFWGGRSGRWERRGYGGPWDDPRARFDDWHRRAHGQDPTAPGSGDPTVPPAGGR